MTDTSNPLLAAGPFPRFDHIRAEHVEPGIRALLADLSDQLAALEREAEPTWVGLIEPFERIHDALSFRWGIVGHLMAVANTDQLRAAHEAMQPEVVSFGVRLGQSRPIYERLCALREGSEWARLDATQQRIVTVLIRDAQLTGVGLEGAARLRFNEIQTDLADLSTRFSNHVLDATKAFALTLHDRAEVEGLPPSALQQAAQAARAAGGGEATPEDGPWRITLDQPSFVPFMQHSRRRALRERLYRAYITRASSGDFDNTPLMSRVLALRREEAELLGYANYADLSLATKMAPSVDGVRSLLGELRTASFEAARRDLDELEAFARAHPELQDEAVGPLAHWDMGFWAERLREERFAYSDEELRPYFPLSRVLDGLFALVRRLFGVTVREADGEAPVWHPDVRFFRVVAADQTPLGAFYLDPYSRPAEKRGGAWMDECVGRSRFVSEAERGVRLPVAYLVCNQTPPVDDCPSLMRFDEVETLFHEFGHGLQHLLTRVDYGFASGIRNVEWDAVELPSQFMENWCYHRETLLGMSRHYRTGERLPEELYEKIRASRTYRAGSQMLRQLSFALTDLALHDGHHLFGNETVFDVYRAVAATTSVVPPLPEDRFLCSFRHIFAGGYAAGYYSYKWAEVLSADAFAAFEEAGLDDATALEAVGRRFRETVLGLGGSRAAMDVFVAFRGRGPESGPLLRHAGLAAHGARPAPPSDR